jgi:hypothetical protein
MIPELLDHKHKIPQAIPELALLHMGLNALCQLNEVQEDRSLRQSSKHHHYALQLISPEQRPVPIHPSENCKGF